MGAHYVMWARDTCALLSLNDTLLCTIVQVDFQSQYMWLARNASVLGVRLENTLISNQKPIGLNLVRVLTFWVPLRTLPGRNYAFVKSLPYGQHRCLAY